MVKSKSGFTIVELLIVIVVIALLAAISVVAYNGIQDRARNTVVTQNLVLTVKALELFNAENGRYPSSNADYTKVKAGLTLTPTKNNTVLYCIDTSNPIAWTLMAGRYPSKSSVWDSTGLRDDANSQAVGSGTSTCQTVTGNANVVGIWGFNIANGV